MLHKGNNSIYQEIERHLKGRSEPVTCKDLMEIPDFRKVALDEYGNDIQSTTNKVSDVLGFMWRKKLLKRYPASGVSTRARWAYVWSEETLKPPVPIPPPSSSKKRRLDIIEEENGDVVIELADVTIHIASKR